MSTFFCLVTGLTERIYRERVYCYELYHQLRKAWGNNNHYSLGGEVDKRGHPYIRGPGLNNAKPDLLVHTPGNMGENLVVIEVKPIKAEKSKIEKDLKALTALLQHGEYYKAMYLVYGNDQGVFETFKKRARSLHRERPATLTRTRLRTVN